MNTEHVKEYRQNGSLKYECTKKWLNKSREYLYSNRVTNSEGKSFIRIKNQTKYNKDGTIQSRLIYNDFGKVIGTHKGTTI